jgi:nitroimidazol reductase NimA-like FMN-containing flavoprotein (pyridoxamine 5'-phosphate oxidase superfamily)
LLAATSSAHLAYNAEDRTPRVIPVGFFWTSTEFVISTATTSPEVEVLTETTAEAILTHLGGVRRS